MPLTRTIVRPKTTVTENESSSQSAAITEGGSFWYVDVTATVNSQLRLLTRIKITPVNVGPNQSYEIDLLDFSSSANATFVAGRVTTPYTEAEADAIHRIGRTPEINMHTLYVTAGDLTAS
jgi:hypothetical protein